MMRLLLIIRDGFKSRQLRVIKRFERAGDAYIAFIDICFSLTRCSYD